MWHNSLTRLAAATSALLLLGLVPSLAQSGASSQVSGLKLSGDKPIQIESDKLEVRQAENLAVFTGNVTVVQGPTLLKAGKMMVYYVKDPNAAAKGTEAAGAAMTGSANIDHLEVSSKVYIKSDDQVATGDNGTFDMNLVLALGQGDTGQIEAVLVLVEIVDLVLGLGWSGAYHCSRECQRQDLRCPKNFPHICALICVC